MKTVLVAGLLAASALTGVTAALSQSTTAAPAATQPAPAEPAAKAGPTFGSFGFDEQGMDRTVAPGDDFYAYANGGWAKATPIPARSASASKAG